MRVLIAEDEISLNDQLKSALEKHGYTVDQAFDGRDALYLATEFPQDLVIMDLGLPQLDGVDVIRRLREAGTHCPVLILTARDHWQEKVRGLEAGADDYVVKPFHVEEVLARLNALLRRSVGLSQPVITFGDLALDTARSEIRYRDMAIELTSYEYRVAEYLMMHAGEVVSKTTLTEHVYAQDYDRDSNVIEVFIGRLRKKLDPDNSLKPIETLRGRGYRFNVQRD